MNFPADLLSKRTIATFLIIGIVILSIPFGIKLAQTNNQITSQAANDIPACDANATTLSISPTNPKVNDEILFMVTGRQGSTWIQEDLDRTAFQQVRDDLKTPGVVKLYFKAQRAGTFTWIHRWHNTPPEDIRSDRQGPECISSPLTFTITDISPPPPSPTPPATFSPSIPPSPSLTSCDFNEDGIYDDKDFRIWSDEFTGNRLTLRADCNGDGRVDLADFNKWRNEKIGSRD